MANEVLRKEVKAAGLYLWQIAEELGIYDSTFSKKLRKELPEDEKLKIKQIIAELSGERKAAL